MPSKNKTIGVFFGGRSPEHEVSIITGEMILAELKKMGYSVQPVYLTKDGRWILTEEVGQLKFFQGEEKELDDKLARQKSYHLDLNRSTQEQSLIFRAAGWFKKAAKKVDLVFPAFHGQNGEDGTFQGLVEFLGVPYVGNGVLASALTIDKAITLDRCRAHGYPTVDFIVIEKKKNEKEKKGEEGWLKKIKEKLKFPLFVKPARAGSSLGISRAENERELKNALEVAWSYDTKVVVEEAVENLKDLTCAVRELRNGQLQASLVQESVFEGQFFDYEEKYLNEGGAQLGANQKNIIIPAKIGEELTQTVQKLSREIFSLFTCSGLARVDFLYDQKRKKLFVGEINTIPGTLYHHLWRATGVSLSELIGELLAVAERNHQQRCPVSPDWQMQILREATALKLQYDK